MMMSMVWHHVSELRPPTGILFIPQVIYQYGEPWWNDIGRRNSRLAHQSSLASLPAESSNSTIRGTGRRKWWIWLFEVWTNILRKAKFIISYEIGRRLYAYFSSEKKACCGLLSPGWNPRTLGPIASTLAITPPMTTIMYVASQRKRIRNNQIHLHYDYQEYISITCGSLNNPVAGSTSQLLR
jgi:hypothetical protein